MAEELYATLQTTKGDVVIRLFPNHAPKTVSNFVGLAEGTKEWTDPQTGQATTGSSTTASTFHRVIDGFMIQGGCPLGTGTGGPGYTFDDEIHPELRSTARTCWRWPTPASSSAAAPTARSSSSPSSRRRG